MAFILLMVFSEAIFFRVSAIFSFSSIRSTSYLWESCMNHSSVTFPLTLSSYSRS